MLDSIDFANKVGCLAKVDRKLAYQAAETRRLVGPRPTVPREVRSFLPGVPDAPLQLQLNPQVCNDFMVTDFSYAIEWPDTFFPGSMWRGQAGINQAKWPGIDVSLIGTGAPAWIWANRNLIQSVTDRLAGDQAVPSRCETCWLIQYCDFLTVQFFLRRALAASESPMLVVLTWRGFEVACKPYRELSLEEANEGLARMGYLQEAA
jgi:hypothetical protein